MFPLLQTHVVILVVREGGDWLREHKKDVQCRIAQRIV